MHALGIRDLNRKIFDRGRMARDLKYVIQRVSVLQASSPIVLFRQDLQKTLSLSRRMRAPDVQVDRVSAMGQLGIFF